ncbi:MAG: hypothetical protein KC431_12255, partial [Myxococcales bacterium]|nr:hypothetical protein [Myxococcales bacterium]
MTKTHLIVLASSSLLALVTATSGCGDNTDRADAGDTGIGSLGDGNDDANDEAESSSSSSTTTGGLLLDMGGDTDLPSGMNCG